MEPAYANVREHGQRGGTAGTKRGDIFAVMTDGRLVIANIVTAHRWRAPSAATWVGSASQTAGAAAAAEERSTRRVFEALGQDSGYDFVPPATDSYGRLRKTILSFVSKLGTMAASRNGRLLKLVIVASALQKLSCALCNGNVRMYLASMFSLFSRGGRRLDPDSDVPVAEVGEV
jgi:hypothetical protein